MAISPEQILEHVRQHPGQKAKAIATALGSDVSVVNRALYGPLFGKVNRDGQYQWFRADASTRSAGLKPETALTPLGRLCRYYLACLEADVADGDSIFATSKFDDLQYAPLARFPLLPDVGPEVYDNADCRRLLQRHNDGRNPMAVRLGYPIRLRRISTPRWTGLKLEPVASFATVIEDGSALPDIDPRSFFFNLAALRGMPGCITDSPMSEGLLLLDELGLAEANAELPEWDELFLSLRQCRPLWDWIDPLDPYALRLLAAFDESFEPGIYNCAVLYLSARSQYTRGLEHELNALAEMTEADCRGTALDRLLNPRSEDVAPDNSPLLEVLPLNNEQRAAVRHALTTPVSVVTGPPGTGKSQVVTSILVNASQRGQTALFASKNNKAVDVVEQRVNGLTRVPALVRLGSKEQSAAVSQFISSLLSSAVSVEDHQEYKEASQDLKAIHEEYASTIRQESETVGLRNRVGQLAKSVEPYRASLPSDVFARAFADALTIERPLLEALGSAIKAADRRQQPWWDRFAWPLIRSRRIAALQVALDAASIPLQSLGLTESSSPATEEHIPKLSSWHTEGCQRAEAIEAVRSYGQSVRSLSNAPRLEVIAAQLSKIQSGMAETSLRFWQARQRVLPQLLTASERQAIGRYSALLQTLATASKYVSKAIAQTMALFPNVRKALPCWAVTSLSARGRLPLTPGLFDLLVIDEASQCDIASALPLLFRAKRVVFIGDSQQLRHVSTLPPDRDRRLLEQHGLLETHHDWLYSARSLYDIAVSHVESGAVTMLRDHHRSHADIIGFSNQQFYRGDLRVATKEANLKRPRGMTKAVEWQHVAGHAERPRSGSWVNREEAAAVIGILRDLLLVRAYEGTVGVVTPFQAQGRLIEELVSRDSALAAAAARVQFLADTVHAFQGDERDTMVFSPVVSRGIEPKTYSWLNSNGNLFNVAITRARAALIVVGDRECCANCPVDYLAAFARYSGRLATPEPEHSPDQPVPEIYPTVRDPSRVSDWERAFYPHLVHLGLRPIPQYKIEQYELDFAIFHRDQKLNIEVDGQRYHADWDGELCYRDRLRNQRLIELGWTVMRFWVYELRDALPDCLARVQRWRASIDQSSPN